MKPTNGQPSGWAARASCDRSGARAAIHRPNAPRHCASSPSNRMARGRRDCSHRWHQRNRHPTRQVNGDRGRHGGRHMKPIADGIEFAAGEPQLAEGSMPADDNATRATDDVTYDRMARHARALRLSRELRIRVVVDVVGWLKDRVEIVYERERRGRIRPYFVRVGHLPPDADLAGEHGVWARCRSYNAALERLHQLAAKLATMLHTGNVSLVPGSAIAYAWEQLS